MQLVEWKWKKSKRPLALLTVRRSSQSHRCHTKYYDLTKWFISSPYTVTREKESADMCVKVPQLLWGFYRAKWKKKCNNKRKAILPNMVTYVRLVKWLDNLPMNRVMLTITSSSDQKQLPSNRIPPSDSWHGQRKDDFPSPYHPYCPAPWGQWGTTERQGSVINNLSLLLQPCAASTMRPPSCFSMMAS